MTAPDGTAAALPPSACPFCEYVMDAATDVDGDATPSPGDFSLCLNCASILVFDEGLRLGQPTHEQMREAPDQLWAIQQQVKTVAKVEPRYERLPCGCVMGHEGEPPNRAFVFIPHALDCKYMTYVQDEMRRTGKPVTVLDAR